MAENGQGMVVGAQMGVTLRSNSPRWVAEAGRPLKGSTCPRGRGCELAETGRTSQKISPESSLES